MLRLFKILSNKMFKQEYTTRAKENKKCLKRIFSGKVIVLCQYIVNSINDITISCTRITHERPLED